MQIVSECLYSLYAWFIFVLQFVIIVYC